MKTVFLLLTAMVSLNAFAEPVAESVTDPVDAPVATPVTAPKTVCTMTFNSENEKQLFKRNTQGMKFVELGPQNTENPDWLGAACKRRVQCDVLIISAHFDGDFYGEKMMGWMSPDDMEQQACNASCDGIFKRPKEVFLFGCNTLSSEDSKHRDIAKFEKSLMSQGYSRHDADIEADRHFPPTGDSIFDKMRRIFRTQKIYGFYDLAPAGTTITPYLTKYLKGISSYPEHLDTLSEEPNTALANAFYELALVETHGVSDDYRSAICRRP